MPSVYHERASEMRTNEGGWQGSSAQWLWSWSCCDAGRSDCADFCVWMTAGGQQALSTQLSSTHWTVQLPSCECEGHGQRSSHVGSQHADITHIQLQLARHKSLHTRIP